MNEKQAKLVRYFVKHTGDINLAKQTRAAWSAMTAKQKGKVSGFMKKAIVTMMEVKRLKGEAQKTKNLQALKGFIS